jgi:hypothetical protein
MNKSILALTLAAVGAFGTLVMAQSHDHGTQATTAQSSSADDANMMQAAMTALDKADASLATAMTSNDPAKKQIAEAKRQLSMCPMMKGGMMGHGQMNHMSH